MTTWRNDSSVTYRVTDISGEVVDVRPGAIVQSHYDLSELSGMTQVSDLPHHVPFELQQIHFGTPGTSEVTVNDKAESLMIYNRTTYSGEASVAVSGEVDIKFDSSSNPVEAHLQSGQSVTFSKADVHGKVGTILVEAFGKTSVDIYAFVYK